MLLRTWRIDSVTTPIIPATPRLGGIRGRKRSDLVSTSRGFSHLPVVRRAESPARSKLLWCMNIPNKLSSRHGRRIWLTLAILGAIFSPTFGLAGTPSEPAASLPSNTIVATIPVGSDPGSIAVSPNSQTVYVADYDAATVSVIDAASNTVTFTITVGNSLPA